MSVLWTSEELRDATNGRLEADVSVTGISIDTRTLKSGDLFIAHKGDASDGKAQMAKALEAGAGGVRVNENRGTKDRRRPMAAETKHVQERRREQVSAA